MRKISLLVLIISISFIHNPIESSISYKSMPIWDFDDDVINIDANGTVIGPTSEPSIDILALYADVYFSQVRVRFSDTPIIDGLHLYMIEIVWEYPYNVTYCYAGGKWGPDGVANGSRTYLKNSTGFEVVNETLYGDYTIVDNNLIFANISLASVTNPLYPVDVNVTTVYYILETNTVTTNYFGINELHGRPIRCFRTDGLDTDSGIELTSNGSLNNIYLFALESVFIGVMIYLIRKRK